MKFLQNYPIKERQILTKSGADFIKSLGNVAVREAVISIFEGENVRNSTEFITRRRLAISNGAMLMMFIKSSFENPIFIETLLDQASHSLILENLRKNDRWILEWLLGLNDKAVQNILRDNPAELKNYQSRLSTAVNDSLEYVVSNFGDIKGTLNVNGKKTSINWDFMLKLMLSVGAQTLTIRGSEKSTYGKLFEKLILGTLLEILGFEFIKETENLKSNDKVFWLSKTEKRESDATLIYSLGKGIRFDIGFIGRGNPEISLDKVTRFEREVTIGKTKHYLGTYVIVDRIGDKSKITTLAQEIGGDIVQMSLSFWIRDVAKLLKRDLNYSHPVLSMGDEELRVYLIKQIKKIDIIKFIR